MLRRIGHRLRTVGGRCQEDLGADLGTGAHLTALRRTRVGGFGLAGAVDVTGSDEPPALLGLGEVVRRCLPTRTLRAEQAADVGFGRRLPGLTLTAEVTALLGPDEEFLALYRPDGPDAVAVAVFTG